MAKDRTKNLKPFTSENQPPASSKSRKGIPNRATVFKKLLDLKVSVKNPADEEKKIKLTMYEAAALGQLQAAMNGNPQAWKEIQDTLHGKMPDKLDVGNKDDKPFKTEEQNNLKKLRKLSNKDLLNLKEINKKLNAA
jgi:hypothetical protein